MLFAGISAHFMKLNKVVTIAFSNISIPPMIPFIVYACIVTGAFVTQTENMFSIEMLKSEKITYGTFGVSLGQYVIGSFVFAALAGFVTFLFAYALLLIFKRKPRFE